ncbi:MAG: DUF6468 domain-containing protein [Rickettsiales bacterium]|nr:DUF6468 domain-containing protein [Rickettsiales bacterium]
MTIEITLNIIICILLAITAVLGLRLGKKISSFNQTKTELEKFIISFNESIRRAENNVNELKATGTSVDENLKAQIKKARFLANDLSYLSEKAENVASQLDEKISSSREIYRKVMVENPQATQAKPIYSQNLDFTPPNKNIQNTNKDSNSPSKKNALDALLKQIAKKKEEITKQSS